MNHTLRVDYHLDLIRLRIEQPASLDQLQAFVHHARRIHGDLAPHGPVRVGAGLVRRHMFKISQRSLTERTTGSRKKNPPHADLAQATGKITGHALENRVVLTVERQQYRATLAHSLHKECAGHDQRFFISQQDFLAGIDSGQGRAQASGSDNGRHHSIHLGIGRNLLQSLLAHQHLSGQASGAQVILQAPRSNGPRHYSKTRRMAHAQRQQLTQAREAGQCEDLIAFRVTRDHIQGAQPYRASRTQHGYLLQAAHEAAIHNSTAKIGIAAVRLSMRSSTPPWPGNRLLLSLIPAWRLNMLSVRSPTTEINTTMVVPSKARHSSFTDQSRTTPTTSVMTKVKARPPYTPSQLLPGLTAGANLRLPKARPEK